MQCDSVIFKKQLGILLLSSTTLTWGPTSESIEISIPFKQIKAQFVNTVKPNGKIILKLELWPQNKEISLNFMFQTVEGREQVKNFISERISSSTEVKNELGGGDGKRELDSSNKLSQLQVEARQSVLKKDAFLAKMHLEYVVTRKLLTEEEFWETRQQSLLDSTYMSKQKRGPSSILLAEPKAQSSEGTGEMKIILNAEMIHTIFTHYPSVHKAYQENVPLKMSEKEFWSLYLNSQYYLRKLSGATDMKPNENSKDIFDQFVDLDAQDGLTLSKDLNFQSQNKLLDLTLTGQDHLSTGNAPDYTMQPGISRKVESSKNSLFLIRKFNRHGSLVLDSSQTVDSSGSKRKLNHTDFNKIYLKETELSELNSEKPKDCIPLQVKDPQSYFPTSLVQLDNESNVGHVDNPEWNKYTNQLSNTNAMHFINQNTTSSSMIVLELLKKRKIQSLRVNHPIPVTAEYKSWHSNVNELLRHYWSLDKLKSQEAEAKRIKIVKLVNSLVSESNPSFHL